ncbi:MAG: dihydrodipicolinate synthase family protein [Luteolibacter sp.]|jgi:4-hydroxy-tetrahydrodipicolinate synthase|nr:dihydrodipicolinate synthase family protein [Luteolibacter sp.]
MSAQPKISGIYTPNIVPFHADHSLHEGELRRMTSWLIEKGINGLYPNGSTGEFIRLSFEDRLRVVKIMAEETNGRVPILAGASESNSDQVLKACKYYADLGCRAVSLTGPYYFKVSQESIESYFRDIAAKSPIDILLYNIPQFSNEISLPVVKRLALDCPRIVGIKDSSRDFPRFCTMLAQIKPQRSDFVCFTGTEEILYPTLMMGADGGTIATSGVIPEVISKLYRDFLAGKHDECRRVQLSIQGLISEMFAAGNFPEGFRAAVGLRGFDPGPPRFPLSPAELVHLEAAKGKLACLLGECGYADAARECELRRGSNLPQQADVDSIVRAVLERLNH